MFLRFFYLSLIFSNLIVKGPPVVFVIFSFMFVELLGSVGL